MIHIFRNIPDNVAISIPLWLHSLILLIFICGFIVIKIKKKSSYLAPSLVILLIIHQSLLYGWYIFGKYHTLTEGLPLYHCRLAILFLTIYYFTKYKILAQLGVQIGLLGSIISLVAFVPDPFLFPHITQFTYVIGHAVLGWYAWWILLTINPLLTKKDLIRNNFIILTINIFLIITDYLLNANYGFFMEIPVIDDPQPLIIKQILLIILFNSIIYIFGWLVMITQNIIKKGDIT